MSRLLITALLLRHALINAQPMAYEKHSAMAGGSLSFKMLPPAVNNMFHPSMNKINKRDTKWIVQAGDTGNGIAVRLGIDFVQLASMNPTVQWANLQIGQVLRTPCEDDGISPVTGSTHHIVVAGDTGNAIAAAAGITFVALAAANPGVYWYNLQIGQTLNLPTSGSNTTTTATSSSSFEFMSITTPSLSTFPPSDPTPSPTDTIPASQDPSQGPSTQDLTLDASLTGISPPSDDDLDELPPTQLYPLDEPGTNPFLTPGTKQDLPLVKMRLVRNEQSQATYTVKAGDTGNAIAAVAAVSFNDLSSANPGVIWTNLQIGQILKLPAAKQIQVSGSTQSQPRKAGQDVYVTYSGPAAIPQYPPLSSWLDFKTLWKSNLPNIGTNCNFPSGKVPINMQTETSILKKAILAVSAETSVNPSFILATILQESAGCVRAPTTKSWEGISNSGLMQSFKGRYTCNTGSETRHPCTPDSIKNMIMEGVKGNINVGIVPALKLAAVGFGISWPMTKAPPRAQADQKASAPMLRVGVAVKVDEALLYYQAARIYNSGSLPKNGDLSAATGSTRCYVSDIVNRLTGWVNAKKGCSL